MSDSDLLSRAARALREAHDGRREGSGFTRARVLATAARERRRRNLRWAVLAPLASLLVVGSAWAQSTGKWPAIWRAVSSVFVESPQQQGASRVQRGAREGAVRPPRALAEPDAEAPLAIPPESAAPGSARAEPASGPSEGVAPERSEKTAEAATAESSIATPPARDASRAAAAPPRAVGSARRSSLPGTQRRATPARAAAASEAREPRAASERPSAEPGDAPARDRELSLFRAAHDLHFAGDRPREAIAAYERYLRDFPRGRFVPEARYNIGLDHIKLGELAAAREALAPFAEGRHGGYRQEEAQRLLEALR